MRVSGLDDKETDNYFIAMMTGKEMRPSIEGSGQQGFCEGIKARAGQQGYHEGIKAGSGQGRAEVLEQGLEKGLGQIGIAAGLSLEKIESIRHR